MTLIKAIKYQICNLCNKNLCFIRLKQVLNCKVHNLGKTASGSYFGRFLYAGIYCTAYFLIPLYSIIRIKDEPGGFPLGLTKNTSEKVPAGPRLGTSCAVDSLAFLTRNHTILVICKHSFPAIGNRELASW